MDIKGLIADHMGHFSLYDIPNVLFVLVMATLLGYVLARWGAGESASAARRAAFWACVAALATALVRSQLPIAALVLAAAFLIGKREDAPANNVLHFSVLVIGIGCGSGATVIVVLAFVPFILLMRWALRPAQAK
jgi:hypothetical protein